MGNACFVRDDDFEADRRAYDAYKRLHAEVKATLSDHSRLQQECAQSFRMACTDRCVPQLSKPLLMEMTFHFLRRLQCDSNERLVQAVMRDLDALCPGQDASINQAQFTEFTRGVLRHVQHELKERLNRLDEKNGGVFGAVADRLPSDRQLGGLSGGVVPSTLGPSDPSAGQPGPARGSEAMPTLPLPAPAPPSKPPQADMPPTLPQERLPHPAQAANAADAAEMVTQPQQLQQPQRLQQLQQLQQPPQRLQQQPPQQLQQPLQPQQLQQPHAQRSADVDLTFGPKGRAQGAPVSAPAMSSVDEKVRSAPDVEYEERQLEAMRREIIGGSLRVQVYNQNFQPEIKRLALNPKMGLIAIFGNDGRAVASFDVRDLQCVTRGIAKSIMDPPPDPLVTSALRFKDNFLCLEFDSEVTCHYALKAFSVLCGVPIYNATDPSAAPQSRQPSACQVPA